MAVALRAALAVALCASLACGGRSVPSAPRLTRQQPDRFHLGAPAAAEDIARWDIDVNARGDGLPPGRGDVREGAAVYALKCAACHGASGEGTPAASQLVHPSDPAVRPRRNIASHWPYAPPLFDYIRRTMPPEAAGSLPDSEVYALLAYLLHQNGIAGPDAVMDAAVLPRVTMPSRDKFVRDDRRGGPEVR